ncbi:MAG: dicarboxylate/amino acid:cation symporter [Oscillospiraceae bacterium]
MNKSDFWKNYRFPLILIVSIVVGCLIGVIFGEKATVLSPLGDIFLNLMFTIVVPLVFVSIASAVGNMMNMKRLGKIIGYTILVFVVTGLIAGVIILIVVNIFPPAMNTSIALTTTDVGEASSIGALIVNALTVNDFSGILSRKNMLPLIVFSIIFGFCVSACGGKESPVGRLLENLSNIVMKFVKIIMYYAPIGMCAYFAALIGEFGPNLIGDYGRAMLIYYPLCVAYFLLMFPVYVYYAGGREGVRSFFKNILTPTVTSIGTQSSIATLPVNLEAAGRIGVPKDIREIVLPMGATMHMDGSVISSVLKISFLYGIFGMPFTGVGTYLVTILISILGGVVMSGVPGGGLVGEMLIVSLFGFPPEAFPIIAMIGFLVDPPATCINATGDTVVSMIVTKLIDGKDWMKKNLG